MVPPPDTVWCFIALECVLVGCGVPNAPTSFSSESAHAWRGAGAQLRGGTVIYKTLWVVSPHALPAASLFLIASRARLIRLYSFSLLYFLRVHCTASRVCPMS